MQCGLCGRNASDGRCNNSSCFNVGNSSNMVSSYNSSPPINVSSSNYGQMPSYPLRVAPVFQARVVYPQPVMVSPYGWGGAVIGGPFIGGPVIYRQF